LNEVTGAKGGQLMFRYFMEGMSVESKNSLRGGVFC